MRELYEDGLIWLYRWTWGMSERPTKPDPLSHDEAVAEIAATWWREIPLKSANVYMAVTQKAQVINADPS